MKILNLAPIDWDNYTEPVISYHGLTISSSMGKLRKLLGPPAEEINDGEDKVNIEWHLKLEDGTDFHIYDWKLYRVLKETDIINFHVSYLKERDTDKIHKALLKLLA